MANPRTRAKIEARIRERAAYCVEFELNDPRAAFITVTKVEVSSDLSLAKIFYSVYGARSDRTRAAHMLEDATGFVRRQVGRVLKTRRVPGLRWVYDDSIEYAAEVERKIADALRHDREVNPGAHEDLLLDEPDGEEGSARLESEYFEFLDAQDEEEGLGGSPRS